MSERPLIPRSVKPRKRTHPELPIIVCDGQGRALSHHTGEYGRIESMIRTHPRANIVCTDTLKLLLRLHDKLQDDPTWNFRVSPVQREVFQKDATIVSRDVNVVNFLGFRKPGKTGRSSHRYFYPISPSQFCRKSIHELIPGDLPELEKLLKWALDLRSFATENNLRIASTGGGIAGQLLRDSRFYSSPRRKVPTSTNESIRKALPGNCYILNAETDILYASAYYVDQSSAHHYAAERIEFPHSDRIYAHGKFRSLSGEPWIRSGTEVYKEFIQHNKGLLYCRVDVPIHVTEKRFIPQNLWLSGEHDIFIYTNELEYYQSLGVVVRWISAAWTSDVVENGLNKYAKWAQEQIQNHPEQKAWLKSTLLAPYGILAAKPRKLRNGLWYSDKGEREDFYIGPQRLNLFATETKKPVQMPTANIIHRGMIEAETRRISLELASSLTEQGHTILSVYADGLIIKDQRQQLPLLPAPWRTKDRLRFIHFIDAQSFRSDLLTKMPGRPKSAILNPVKNE